MWNLKLPAFLGILERGHRKSRCLGLEEKIEISTALLAGVSGALNDA